MLINELLEARRNPKQNPRETTKSLIDRFARLANRDELSVHFGPIEKVGINPQSKNTYGPIGVYAMPILYAHNNPEYWSNQIQQAHSLYVNIIQRKKSARVLDLSTVSRSTMIELVTKTIKWHRKKTRGPADRYLHMLDHTTVRDMYRDIDLLVTNYANRRNLIPMYQLNHWFRRLGYDAILDDGNHIINEMPSQIVFLTPTSYQVLYRARITL